jgi:hypothetical protein
MGSACSWRHINAACDIQEDHGGTDPFSEWWFGEMVTTPTVLSGAGQLTRRLIFNVRHCFAAAHTPVTMTRELATENGVPVPRSRFEVFEHHLHRVTWGIVEVAFACATD